MANAAIAFRNLSDAGTILASSAITLAPPVTLKDPHVARKWRGKNGDTEYLLTSYLTGIDTVGLFGSNMTEAGITRIRVSSADSSGITGDVYDSGSAVGRIDPAYSSLVHLLPSLVNGYVRIDLSEAGIGYQEAGRLFVGPRHQFPINFSWNWSERWIDRSQEIESRGGQTYIDQDVSYRCWSMNFEWVTATFTNDHIQYLDRVIGQRSDFLMIKDPDSANLGKDSLWGRVKQPSPIVQPQVFLSDGPAFSKSFEIYERL